ncbi:MAG TPA: dTDP-4-dehydrorhamnose reductase [Candidatus Binatia bacterium]|nr:dTDP-4-dehydrorhamnose reductase [Candidatus Binatia bacterium]
MSADLLERPLILGAHGQLGTDLMIVFRDRNPIALDQPNVDLTDLSSIAKLFEHPQPTVVINAAAFTNVEQCEREPQQAFAINAVAVDELARLCAQAKIPLVTVSTDYVFSGETDRPYDEHDPAEPINAYGISKLAGELLAKRHGSAWFVFRTSGLYGIAGASGKGYTFVDRVLKQAENGEPVRVVDDMTFSPSYTVDVALAMRRVIESGRFGLYHVTNAGMCTWYEFAREAFVLSGLSPDIQPIKSSEFKTIVRRPMFSALAHGELRRAGFPDLPEWREGLRSYLEARKKTVRC